ncbi:hypothetical protein [Pseudomonas sp. 22 E 5]|nr:hypothetical protein [Pseudomonas sp. 22 E 5]
MPRPEMNCHHDFRMGRRHCFKSMRDYCCGSRAASRERLLLADFCLSRPAETDPKLTVATVRDRPKAAPQFRGVFVRKNTIRKCLKEDAQAPTSRTMQPCRIPPVQGFFELKANKKESRTRLRYGPSDFIQIFHSRLPLWFGPFNSDGATHSDREVDTHCILSINRRGIEYVIGTQFKSRGKFSV